MSGTTHIFPTSEKQNDPRPNTQFPNLMEVHRVLEDHHLKRPRAHLHEFQQGQTLQLKGTSTDTGKHQALCHFMESKTGSIAWVRLSQTCELAWKKSETITISGVFSFGGPPPQAPPPPAPTEKTVEQKANRWGGASISCTCGRVVSLLRRGAGRTRRCR